MKIKRIHVRQVFAAFTSLEKLQGTELVDKLSRLVEKMDKNAWEEAKQNHLLGIIIFCGFYNVLMGLVWLAI